MNSEPEDCSTCRYHSKQARAAAVQSAGEDLVEFDDVDQQVYVCRSSDGPHRDQEIGVTPTHCAAWQRCRPPGADEETARALRLWEARQTRR